MQTGSLKRKYEFNEADLKPIKKIKFCNNYNCPITLQDIDELKENNVVIFLWVNGKRYVYNMHELYNYIFKFKFFLEPYTKYPFTIKQLDYILSKNINNSHIANYSEYNSLILNNPKQPFEYDITKNLYYYKRITNYLVKILNFDNNQLYDFWEDYYASVNNLDVFERNYVILPLLAPYYIKENAITLTEKNTLLSEDHDIRNRFYYCIFTGKKLYNLQSFRIIKLFNTYYNISELFKQILSGHFIFSNKYITLEHLNIIIFRYLKYLQVIGKFDLHLQYKHITYQQYHKQYKFKLIDSINKKLYIYFDTCTTTEDAIIFRHIKSLWVKYWYYQDYSEIINVLPYGALKTDLLRI